MGKFFARNMQEDPVGLLLPRPTTYMFSGRNNMSRTVGSRDRSGDGSSPGHSAEALAESEGTGSERCGDISTISGNLRQGTALWRAAASAVRAQYESVVFCPTSH